MNQWQLYKHSQNKKKQLIFDCSTHETVWLDLAGGGAAVGVVDAVAVGAAVATVGVEPVEEAAVEVVEGVAPALAAAAAEGEAPSRVVPSADLPLSFCATPTRYSSTWRAACAAGVMPVACEAVGESAWKNGEYLRESTRSASHCHVGWPTARIVQRVWTVRVDILYWRPKHVFLCQY